MSFEEIYKLYSQKVFRLCMGYVNDLEWAKDITQDVFITIWQKLPQFRNESSIGTWIFRITTNSCLRQIKRNDHSIKLKTFPDIHEVEDNSINDKIEFLYKCISELPEIDRIIISLELECVTQAQISEIVGMAEGNVRVRIHRIKKTLHDKFTTYDE